MSDSDTSNVSSTASASTTTATKAYASHVNTTNFNINKFEDGSSRELVRLAALRFRTEEINEKVKAYEPTDADIYESLPDGSYVRRIYSGMELREREQ